MSSCLLLPGLACREGGAESCGPIAGVGWGGGGLAAVIPLQEQPEPQGWVWAGCSPAQAALSPASQPWTPSNTASAVFLNDSNIFLESRLQKMGVIACVLKVTSAIPLG